MNISLQSAGYIEKYRETVLSGHGSAEILEIYSPSGRFIGFQVYRNGKPEYEQKCRDLEVEWSSRIPGSPRSFSGLQFASGWLLKLRI
jgi:hypothetical protein